MTTARGADDENDAERPPLAAYRIPPGPHGLPEEFVKENQRWRLVVATAELLAKRGILNLTRRAIARRAGVSPTVISREFSGVDEMLVEGLEAVIVELEIRSRQILAGDKDVGMPQGRLVEGVRQLLLDRPATAALLRWETSASADSVIEVRNRLISCLAALLHEARRPAAPPPDWPAADVLMTEGVLALLLMVEAGDLVPVSREVEAALSAVTCST